MNNSSVRCDPYQSRGIFHRASTRARAFLQQARANARSERDQQGHVIEMNLIEATAKPSQALSKPPKEAKIERITNKVRTAIDAMVWEGLPRSEAAVKAEISEHGLYKALCKPPVKAYYAQQCEVLRTSGRARRIHRLEAMLEQNDNKAAVINAALALESIGTDQATANTAQSAMPGVVIQIVTHAPAAPPAMTIEHSPVMASNPSD
ncbi:hypothetical protein [Bradyrhizobium lablabi]|uniref:hypothetical protein n=1 Tax=Bradyrhizobium lablabi TaxID=722472 RepID=UPI00115FD222|nr:hypothetical protein [Bradyrhizobium lablabi]